jgi:pyruvate formate lyase activating enzyme
MKKAAFFEKKEKKKVQCNLCPHYCIIENEDYGKCLVRKNKNGTLYSENYKQLCSVSIDPIEKKPLYHFYPGKNILSIGSVGCNLKCKFCQNYHISQSGVENFSLLQSYTSDEVVDIALQQTSNIGIAYTYNEPVIWYEYVLETAKKAHKRGLKNVLVSNGFINPKPLKLLLPYFDAFSIDLKGFAESFYQDFTSSRLKPVLNTLKLIVESGKHLEITNLVVTGINDDENNFREMTQWIAKKCGENAVLHISRYFPMFKIKNLPTPESKLESLYKIAKENLNFVYLGNIKSNYGQTTICPACNQNLISRSGYTTQVKEINNLGQCSQCNTQIINH